MIWSDRGGASRYIGERWADHCEAALTAAKGGEWPAPGGPPFRLVHALRLDENPRISREANTHHLENPDFLLIGIRGKSQPRETVIQAVDAKFAADRIKTSQVSAEVVDNLLNVPENGTARELTDIVLRELELPPPSIIRGVFICPESFLTDYLVRRARDPAIVPADIVTIPPDPGRMFDGLAADRLIGPLARVDALSVTPRRNLLAAVYYFRLASACLYLWNEANRPLLTNKRETPEPNIGVVAAEVADRAGNAPGAFEIIKRWAADAQEVTRARKAVAEAASLPLSMREIRDMVASVDIENERDTIRAIRRDLELTFRGRLVDATGVVYPDDPRSRNRLLKDVRKAARGLRNEMHSHAREIIAEQVTLAGVARAD